MSKLQFFRCADISIFHEFHRPPYGGGNQFLLALRGEFEKRGFRIENNAISRSTRVCLYNSFNFDFDRLSKAKRPSCRMVHRVDGPISVYRGKDDGTDRRIWEINQSLADATIFQSQYSLNRHLEMGLQFKSPVVIMNAVDGAIFNPQGRIDFDCKRKIRLISTSWSTNPNKGADVYRWLDDHLDFDRFEYTFCGRIEAPLKRIRLQPAVPSEQVATLLKQHDIYITASQHDPCSNALLEALSCGLPAAYRNSGGHSEIVSRAGYAFESAEEVPGLLDKIMAQYPIFQASINIPLLSDVAGMYLEVMGIG